MTADQFREEALRLGMTDREVACQVELNNKFRQMGMDPIPYETALEAWMQKSCVDVFEMNLAHGTV